MGSSRSTLSRCLPRLAIPPAPIAFALLLCAGCAAVPPVPEPEEWDRELPAGIQMQDLVSDEEEDGKAVIPVRVVADATGEPIPGGEPRVAPRS